MVIAIALRKRALRLVLELVVPEITDKLASGTSNDSQRSTFYSNLVDHFFLQRTKVES
jgi:hypothetical protein